MNITEFEIRILIKMLEFDFYNKDINNNDFNK